MLRGGEELLTELCRRLSVRPGQTTADGRLTVEFAECLGMCEGAPCVLLNDECYPNMTPESTVNLLQQADAAGGSNGKI
jgi:NADH-quinone oxidoreductase subunit E